MLILRAQNFRNYYYLSAYRVPGSVIYDLEGTFPSWRLNLLIITLIQSFHFLEVRQCANFILELQTP